MKSSASIVSVCIGITLGGWQCAGHAASFTEGFNSPALPTSWITANNSTSAATGLPWGVTRGIRDEDGTVLVAPSEGARFAYVDAESVGDDGAGTISNWLITPEIFGMKNGDTFSFYTTTIADSDYPDALEFRLSSAGAGADVGTTVSSVGTFTTTLLSINPGLDLGGYPESWTKYTVTLSGLATPIDGRAAFRYYVTDGGLAGNNSNIIGVDAFSYTAVIAAVPEPGSWSLLLGGFVGMVAFGRYRSRNLAA